METEPSETLHHTPDRQDLGAGSLDNANTDGITGSCCDHGLKEITSQCIGKKICIARCTLTCTIQNNTAALP